MNPTDVWQKLRSKYGVVVGAIIVVSIAALWWLGVIDTDFVMRLINGQ